MRFSLAAVLVLGLLSWSGASRSASADEKSVEFSDDTFSEGHFLSAGTLGSSRTLVPLFGTDGGAGSNLSRNGEITPTLQYFVLNKLAVGLGLDLNVNSSGSTPGAFYQDTYFDFGPTVTYYFWTTDKMAAHAGASYFQNVYSVSQGSSASAIQASHQNTNFNLSTGIDFVASRSVSVGPALNYKFLAGSKALNSAGLSTGASFSFYL